MKPFGILLCNLTSVYTTELKQSLEDSSLYKDSKYIQVYIVPYKHLGVIGVAAIFAIPEARMGPCKPPQPPHTLVYVSETKIVM